MVNLCFKIHLILAAGAIIVAAKPTFARTLPLDVHVHFEYQSEDRSGIDIFLEQKEIQRAFVISPSYAIYKGRSADAPEWMHDLTLRRKLDAKTQQLVTKHKDRLRGLCGFSPLWKDGASVVNECLSKPLMVGIKIHSEDSNYALLKSDNLIRPLLRGLKKKNAILLWHLGLADQIDELFRMTQEFPAMTFIFAHSMYSPDAIHEWVQLEKKAGRRPNVYLETSTNWNNVPETLNEDYVTAWRAFGFDRVLFGSDAGFLQKSEFIAYRKAFIQSLLLNEKEKGLLFETSASKLLKLTGFE